MPFLTRLDCSRSDVQAGCSLQTRRTRTAGKVEIPSVDDHVSKLEHMGRETVKKLADVREAASQAGIDDLKMPGSMGSPGSIETVGQFQQLALAAEHVRSQCMANGLQWRNPLQWQILGVSRLRKRAVLALNESTNCDD